MARIEPSLHPFQISTVQPDFVPISLTQPHSVAFNMVVHEDILANEGAHVRRAVYVERCPVPVEKRVQTNIKVMAGGTGGLPACGPSMVSVESLVASAILEHQVPIGPVPAPRAAVRGNGMEVVVEYVALDQHMSSRCNDTIAKIGGA